MFAPDNILYQGGFTIYRIIGGKKLAGEVHIKGAKNAILALIPAALLIKGTIVLENTCQISDVYKALNIMEQIGAQVIWDDNIIINTKGEIGFQIKGEEVQKYRASYYFMGALLGTKGQVEIDYPGGCAIGRRPIDIHLEGFKAMGASMEIKEEKLLLKGALMGTYLDAKKSVGATINFILAAANARGTTVISNYAQEPEVKDVVCFLRKAGYDIEIEKEIIINGQKISHTNVTHHIMPDRIEALTYIIMGMMLGDIMIRDLEINHMKNEISLFLRHQAHLEIGDNWILTHKSKLTPMEVITSEYPGIPTDIQQLLVVLCSQIEGESSIIEIIFENRFLNCIELNKMGADISIDKQKIIIRGQTKFFAKTVIGTDLRGTMSLVLAALLAEGESIIQNEYHLERGYDNFIDKMKKIGAFIDKNVIMGLR